MLATIIITLLIHSFVMTILLWLIMIGGKQKLDEHDKSVEHDYTEHDIKLSEKISI